MSGKGVKHGTGAITRDAPEVVNKDYRNRCNECGEQAWGFLAIVGTPLDASIDPTVYYGRNLCQKHITKLVNKALA